MFSLSEFPMLTFSYSSICPLLSSVCNYMCALYAASAGPPLKRRGLSWLNKGQHNNNNNNNNNNYYYNNNYNKNKNKNKNNSVK